MLEIAESCAAIFLLDGNPVQAELADFRPEISWKLIALVDLVGARRDLVAREIVHGFADRVRSFAEIEIEHPLRVGNHGRGLRANRAACPAYSLNLWKEACHARTRLRTGTSAAYQRHAPPAGGRPQ